MTIRERDKVTVCRHCKSTNLDGIEHGVWFQDGPESGIQLCIWPECRHEAVNREPWCYFCKPPDPTEAPF